MKKLFLCLFTLFITACQPPLTMEDIQKREWFYSTNDNVDPENNIWKTITKNKPYTSKCYYFRFKSLDSKEYLDKEKLRPNNKGIMWFQCSEDNQHWRKSFIADPFLFTVKSFKNLEGIKEFIKQQ